MLECFSCTFLSSTLAIIHDKKYPVFSNPIACTCEVLEKRKNVECSIDVSIPEVCLASTGGTAQDISALLQNSFFVFRLGQEKSLLKRLMTTGAKLACLILVNGNHSRSLLERLCLNPFTGLGVRPEIPSRRLQSPYPTRTRGLATGTKRLPKRLLTLSSFELEKNVT